MLKPSKHTNPDLTIISISIFLLKHLKKQRIDEYENLRKLIKKKFNNSDVLFLPSLNFLFLMGLIEYRAKTDSLEYLSTNENI